MMRRRIRQVAKAGRPPAVDRLIRANDLAGSLTSASVSLGLGESIAAAIYRIDFPAADRTLLIPDRRPSGTPGPRTVHAVALRLAQSSAVSIGLPDGTKATESQRWQRLAEQAGASVTTLGSSGWNRIDLGSRSLILANADVPAELHADQVVMALSAPVDGGCLALWSDIVHPNTAIRARLATNAVIELSAAVTARYLLTGQIGATWFASLAPSAISAELVARGVERLRERAQGIEGPGPWEDAGVQHLSGIGDDGAAAANLVLHATLDDNAAEELARALSETLGWRLGLEVGENAGGTGDAR